MIQDAKNKVLWTYSWWIDLILHTMIGLNMFQHLPAITCADGPFYSPKNAVVNDPKFQKDVFCHFLYFGRLDRADIAYCNSIKRFPTISNVTNS